MTGIDFVYWLQGFLEIQNPQSINKEQINIIKDHIGLVLKKETPKYLTIDNNNVKFDSTLPWNDGDKIDENFCFSLFEGTC